jgi:hypothetical protein
MPRNSRHQIYTEARELMATLSYIKSDPLVGGENNDRAEKYMKDLERSMGKGEEETSAKMTTINKFIDMMGEITAPEELRTGMELSFAEGRKKKRKTKRKTKRNTKRKRSKRRKPYKKSRKRKTNRNH